jgi:hypothetical protein
MTIRTLAGALVLAAALVAPTVSQAGSLSGVRITKYYVSSSNNLPFRVYTDVAPADCPGGFMYVEFTEPAYQTYVSGLLSAQAQNKIVTFSYVIGSGGFCRITEYQVG